MDKKRQMHKALLSPDRKDHGITVFRESGPEKIHIDVCFPVMHGKNGEDGTIQGLLELVRDTVCRLRRSCVVCVHG